MIYTSESVIRCERGFNWSTTATFFPDCTDRFNMATGGKDKDERPSAAGFSPDKSRESTSLQAVSCLFIGPQLAQFPDVQAYTLRFIYKPRGGIQQEAIDEDCVVLLDSDEQRKTLDLHEEAFDVTSIRVDDARRQIILTHKKYCRSSEHANIWINSVKKEIQAKFAVPEFAVVHTGPSAGELKGNVDREFSSTSLSCTQSKDNQSILLLSNDRSDIVNAQRFIERVKRSSGLAGEVLTSSNIRVSALNADITTLDVDGIVSPVNEHLEHKRGVSQAIAKAAGTQLVDEVKQQLKQNGPARVTEVVVTTGGNLHCQKVLHAVGPRWSDYEDRDLCQRDLVSTVVHCLETASSLGLSSLAFPAISSGYRGVNPDVCVSSYRTALEAFLHESKHTSLRSILFVDVREEIVLAVRRAFSDSSYIVGPHDQDLRIVIVGKSGVGKSSLGNSILGRSDAFDAQISFRSVTEKSGFASGVTGGVLTEVVDTPGLCQSESEDKEDTVKKEIVKSLTFLLPGPHVFLLVLRADDRFNMAEVTVYEKVQELFPDLFSHTIVVYTHADNESDLMMRLKTAPPCLNELLERCNSRVTEIDNKAQCELKEQQVKQLINKVLELKKANEGKYYTNENINQIRHVLMSGKYSDKTFDQIKRDVLSGDEKLLRALLADPETESFVRRLQAKCTIL